MIRYKQGIMQRLKKAGYNSVRMRDDKIIGQYTIQQIRTSAEMKNKTIDTLCRLLDCQPGDILEYIPDDQTDDQQRTE